MIYVYNIHIPHPVQKSVEKWIKDFNIKIKPQKLLDTNIEKKFQDKGIYKNFTKRIAQEFLKLRNDIVSVVLAFLLL